MLELLLTIGVLAAFFYTGILVKTYVDLYYINYHPLLLIPPPPPRLPEPPEECIEVKNYKINRGIEGFFERNIKKDGKYLVERITDKKGCISYILHTDYVDKSLKGKKDDQKI